MVVWHNKVESSITLNGIIMEAWYYWIILGVILWIVEIFSYPFFIIGIFGTSSLVAGLVAFAGFGFKAQLIAFSVGSLIVAYGVRPLFNGFRARRVEKTNVDALLDRVCVVVEEIDADKGSGRVKIGGETWKAVAVNGQVVPVGEQVVVNDVQGCTLFVEVKS
ncbi:NfeD family protein [Prosthecochloris sp. SCSIO W1103]|uniref:NfeD family protein n=1 Tax=Prosthecochloris sp. SCSIO W1103 TaxID=2992244 RepID=UPI00223CE080|nr:NfeD family protein [Prosthecochloris sp. SCSIO W1103]UZJ38904.1 NfeD family protein [Prosthecochloris sp. SCSIO W1103]